MSTRARRFRADFYRYGETTRHCGTAEWPGRYRPPGRYDEDWRWPKYAFSVPEEWCSGVYVVVLTPLADSERRREDERSVPVMDARTARLLFVVTPTRRTSASILYKVPAFTYHAYNTSGGGSLYGSLLSEERADFACTSRVTFRRPGGGVGGPVKGVPDAHDPASPRQTFAHWDARFIAWMERSGIECDFCTDLDLHEGRHLADGYRLLLSAGHDEYWSPEIRQHVTAFRDRGGNIANFGGNTCWWRVKVATDGSGLACDKFPPGVPPGADLDAQRGCPDHWWESAPENELLGVSYRNGGGYWDGLRAPIGFTVQHTDHWVFEGTGLRDGDLLGATDALVGYECDGAAYSVDGSGLAQPTGVDGTPKCFLILGVGRLPESPSIGWSFAARKESAAGRAATFGLYRSGGTVFTAATTDWPRVLTTDPQVRRITLNVIDRLS